jgi:hypothetical protein
MPHTVPFDTHAFIKELKSAGLSEQQAEVQATVLSKALVEFQETHLTSLATRQDLREMELRLKHDLTLRLGGMLVVGITVIATLVKIL